MGAYRVSSPGVRARVEETASAECWCSRHGMAKPPYRERRRRRLERRIWRIFEEVVHGRAHGQGRRHEIRAGGDARDLRVIIQRSVGLRMDEHVALRRAHDPVFRHAGAGVGMALDMRIFAGVTGREYFH